MEFRSAFGHSFRLGYFGVASMMRPATPRAQSPKNLPVIDRMAAQATPKARVRSFTGLCAGIT
jgi:hypothetical protein